MSMVTWDSPYLGDVRSTTSEHFVNTAGVKSTPSIYMLDQLRF